jgi:(2R)-sulfolactate sulfo-lyase subunit alpha|tara:strand:- start:1484 stop:1771 length:288 start_codon:yes stop_codon:yes gene_type:complete
LAGPHYIVHDKTDSVGVVVVEGVKKGQMLTGWVMQGNKTVRMKCLNTIPIGHKIALAPMKKGDTILKYGHDIGKAVAAIKKGGHVHVQNLKTKRW